MVLKKTVISGIVVIFFLTLAALWIGQVYTVNYFLVSNDLQDITHHKLNRSLELCEPLVMVHHTEPSKGQGLEASLNKLFADAHRHRNGKFNPLRHSKLLATVYPGQVTQIYLNGQFLPESECHHPLIKEQIESTISLYLKDQPYLIFYNGQTQNFTNLFQLN